MRQEKSRHKRNKKELAPYYRYLRYTEKQRKAVYDSFSERLSQGLNMTGDVLAGQAILSMMGNHGIRIENYQSILEYSETRVRIATKKKPICIEGRQLCIQYFTKDEIQIVGQIEQVKWCE